MLLIKLLPSITVEMIENKEMKEKYIWKLQCSYNIRFNKIIICVNMNIIAIKYYLTKTTYLVPFVMKLVVWC